jgi:uncharacterized membrane protein YphA (DoxX/SURF4 family)
MSSYAWLQLGVLAAILMVTTRVLGAYIAGVFGGGKAIGDRVFLPVERSLYRICGVDPAREQTWPVYAFALLAFSLVSVLGLVACVMVVVGFKAKFSATLLVVILSVFNLLVNNFWTVSSISPPLSSLLRILRFYRWLTCLVTPFLAPRAPPPQGLRQVRLLPDPLHRWWSPASRQQRPRPVQHRREEEGLLEGLLRILYKEMREGGQGELPYLFDSCRMLWI